LQQKSAPLCACDAAGMAIILQLAHTDSGDEGRECSGGQPGLGGAGCIGLTAAEVAGTPPVEELDWRRRVRLPRDADVEGRRGGGPLPPAAVGGAELVRPGRRGGVLSTLGLKLFGLAHPLAARGDAPAPLAPGGAEPGLPVGLEPELDGVPTAASVDDLVLPMLPSK
jgi:hypothetical protein